MKNEESKIDHLVEHVEEYFQTRQELSKLIAAEKSSVILSAVFANMLIVFIFFFVLVFASIALAYGISQMIGQAYAGFLVVAVLYLVIGVLFFANRERWLKTPMENAVIKNFFKDHDHESN